MRQQGQELVSACLGGAGRALHKELGAFQARRRALLARMTSCGRPCSRRWLIQPLGESARMSHHKMFSANWGCHPLIVSYGCLYNGHRLISSIGVRGPGAPDMCSRPSIRWHSSRILHQAAPAVRRSRASAHVRLPAASRGEHSAGRGLGWAVLGGGETVGASGCLGPRGLLGPRCWRRERSHPACQAAGGPRERCTASHSEQPLSQRTFACCLAAGGVACTAQPARLQQALGAARGRQGCPGRGRAPLPPSPAADVQASA